MKIIGFEEKYCTFFNFRKGGNQHAVLNRVSLLRKALYAKFSNLYQTLLITRALLTVKSYNWGRTAYKKCPSGCEGQAKGKVVWLPHCTRCTVFWAVFLNLF